MNNSPVTQSPASEEIVLPPLQDIWEILYAELRSPQEHRRHLAAERLLEEPACPEEWLSRFQQLLASETDINTRDLLELFLESLSSSSAPLPREPWLLETSQRRSLAPSFVSATAEEQKTVFLPWLHRERDKAIVWEMIRRLRKIPKHLDPGEFFFLLDHSWNIIRARAIRLVAKAEISLMIKRLPKFLTDPDPLVRLAAVQALDRHLPHESARLMREGLGSLETPIRLATLQAAFSYDFAALEPAVLHILASESDPGVLALAGLLVFNNPSRHVCHELFRLAAGPASERRSFLGKLARKVFDSCRYVGLIESDANPDQLAQEATGKDAPIAEADTQATLQASATEKEFRKSLPPSPTEEEKNKRINPTQTPDQLGRKLKSSDVREVLDALDGLRNTPDALLPYLQKLVRHQDVRIRARIQGFLTLLDPAALMDQVRCLLRHPHPQTRQQGLRIAFLMDPAITLSQVIETYDRETEPKLKGQMQVFFLNNPSRSLLGILIGRTATRTGEEIQVPAIVGEVYEKLQLIEEAPLPSLADLLKRHAPPDHQQDPRLRALERKVRAIPGGGGADATQAHFPWGLEFTKDLFEHISLHPLPYAFAIVVLLLGFLASQFAPTTRPPRQVALGRADFPGKRILTGQVVAANPQVLILKTNEGMFVVHGPGFSRVQPSDEVRNIVVEAFPKENTTGKRLTFRGSADVRFVTWHKPTTPDSKGSRTE